jgi:signal transduction histidine kinase
MREFLRKVPLFANLPDEDLNTFCQGVEDLTLASGELLFEEGSPGDKAYVIKSGELEILKESNGREVLLAVRGSGDIIGEIALLEDVPRTASVRSRGETELLVVHKAQVDFLINSSPQALRSMFFTVLDRWRDTEAMLRQSEKMAQLGKLTSGVAHELNNPAAAVKRASAQLDTLIEDYGKTYGALDKLKPDANQQSLLDTLESRIQQHAKEPLDLDGLARSDREYELEEWLDEHGIDESWDYAVALVDIGYTKSELDELNTVFPMPELVDVVAWLKSSYDVHSLLFEIQEGSSRISEIVKGLKTYSYLDQAPVQTINIREGIDSTLAILRSKIKEGITIHTDYDPDLPLIEAYGSELNQVWTNIIDNAIDALDGRGIIEIRTRREGENWVIVEIGDNGPGIPKEIQGKVFDTFFTTKEPGKGTGLGLDISYKIILKHKGDIKLYSKPGVTRFEIWLPVNFEAV